MRGLYQGYFNHISREVNKLDVLCVCVCAILFLLDTLFIDTISSMGRFQGVVRVSDVMLNVTAFTTTAPVGLLSGEEGRPMAGGNLRCQCR